MCCSMKEHSLGGSKGAFHDAAYLWYTRLFGYYLPGCRTWNMMTEAVMVATVNMT